MVNTYKFCKTEILIQFPGEPREQNLGDVRPSSLSYTKFHKNQNDRKCRILGHIFKKKSKKIKNEVTVTEKHHFG